MKTNKEKHTITVLLNIDKPSEAILENAIGLAKMINGEIHVFYVKKPRDVVNVENQLSAKRTINSEQFAIDKRIKNFIGPISKQHGIKIKHSFVFGNLKNEIKAHIKANRPDIILLGMKKPRPLGLIGDNISEFILNIFDGPVLVAAAKNAFMSNNSEISMGFLNGDTSSFDSKISEALMKRSQKPLKSFKIVKGSVGSKERSGNVDKETVEFVFENNDGAVDGILNNISRNNIDLLVIDRTPKESGQQNLITPHINKVINKCDTTLLISRKDKYHLGNHELKHQNTLI